MSYRRLLKALVRAAIDLISIMGLLPLVGASLTMKALITILVHYALMHITIQQVIDFSREQLAAMVERIRYAAHKILEFSQRVIGWTAETVANHLGLQLDISTATVPLTA